MENQNDHLKLLSVFHFVVAGLAGLFACFPIFHLMMGISMLSGEFFPAGTGVEFPAPFTTFGLMFTILPAVMILLGWAFAVALAVSGYFLSRRRNYLYCLVMAAVSCIFVPFGTVLGAFTIAILMKDEVKAQFT